MNAQKGQDLLVREEGQNSLSFSFLNLKEEQFQAKKNGNYPVTFKYIAPQISCLGKSEMFTTIDNEIIKN